MKKSIRIATLLTLLSVATNVWADNVRRVVFPKGKTTVTYRGKLQRNYADYDAYVLRARRGQSLTVRLTTADLNAYITIYETKQLGPDEDAIIRDVDFPREWSGKIPLTSEYSIQVYGVRSIDDPESSGDQYSIEISLK